MQGKIILSLAISLDGYIANEIGGYDWISGDGDNSLDTEEKYDLQKLFDSIDTVVMGGDCYRQDFAKDFQTKIVYIATSKTEKDRDNLRFISGDIVSIIQEEKQKGGKILLFGGGKTIDPFIKSDVIDEYHVAIIPTILGVGRKLFLDNNPTIKLHLKSYTVSDGTPTMIYSKR